MRHIRGLVASVFLCLIEDTPQITFPPRLGRQFADGADVVDYFTDIPLPGRSLAAPTIGKTERFASFVLPTFVAGPENRLVGTTVNHLLDAATVPIPSQVDGAPPFAPAAIALFGRSGTGKTHLAHGLVRYWQKHLGSDAALYVTATDFRRHFIAAVRNDSVAEFRRLVRGRSLVAIDDLHQLPADDAILQELRHTLDDYEENGRIVLVTSVRPASSLANLSPDLRSRLASAVHLQVSPPGPNARLRIIRQVSTALQHSLSDQAARQLATGIAGTAADMIGALFELWSRQSPNEVSDTRDAARLLAGRRPTLREIVALVARYTGTTQRQLKSGSRKQAIVFARAIAIYLTRELTGASYQEIGKSLGGRDHTTVMHNYWKINNGRLSCPITQDTLDELQRLLSVR